MIFKEGSKLFLSGEYSILSPKHTAVILYIKKYLTLEIEASNEFKIFCDFSEERIKKICKFSHEYLKQIKVDVKKYSLKMISTNQYINNKKIGVGSSASSLVGIVRSILAFHGINLDNISLFKLCVLISYKLEEKGSKADIATIVYKKHIKYTKFIEESINFKLPFKENIEKNWDGLSIKEFIPKYRIYILWTEEEAKTDIKINEFNKFNNKDSVKIILNNINLIANSLTGEISDLKLIKKNNDLMYELDKEIKIGIVTKKIKALQDKLKKDLVISKISGAGGGDCILLLSDKKLDYNNIEEVL